VEILPRRFQLAGKLEKGFPVKRSHWGTSQKTGTPEHDDTIGPLA